MARPSDPDDNDRDDKRDDKHLKPHPEQPIADRPEVGPVGMQIIKAKAPPKSSKEGEGEMTRVLLTGDNRTVAHEAYIPTADFGFRIFFEGQHYEQIGEHADSGARIYGPTR
jgi:hypothetical protein